MTAEAPVFEHAVSQMVREYAMSLPEATEGSSCVNRAFSAGGKNFAFYGEKGETCTLRIKLAAEGWTKLVFTPHTAPAGGELEAWITESFSLLAPSRIARQLDDVR